MKNPRFANQEGGILLEQPDGVDLYVDCGELYESALNGEFGPIAEYVAPPPAPPQVPQSITMRQCRLQLHATGKLGLVQPAIDSMPEPHRTEASIEWEYGSVVLRASPIIAQLAPVFGWETPEEIDQQFREAAQR